MYSCWAQAMTGDAPGGIERLSDGVAIHVNSRVTSALHRSDVARAVARAEHAALVDVHDAGSAGNRVE